MWEEHSPLRCFIKTMVSNVDGCVDGWVKHESNVLLKRFEKGWITIAKAWDRERLFVRQFALTKDNLTGFSFFFFTGVATSLSS